MRALFVALVLAPPALVRADAADVPPLGLPIDCTPGEDCFVQKYVDVDGGDGIADYVCGTMTSHGHKGTDFRVLPMAEADILAAAAGTVKAVRDGMPDNRFAEPITTPSERACGNAVLIDHGGGVETIVCHMAPGSLAVAVGDAVAAGDVLGKVGASGQAGFRHVHFQVMVDGAVLDPFTGRPQDEASCGNGGAPLWDDATTDALDDTPRSAVLAAGFAPGQVTIAQIQDAEVADPAAGGDALVAYGLAMGAEAGDRHRLTLTGPGIDIDNETAQERHQAQSMRFVGRRINGGLQPGAYTMRYELRRDGRVVDVMEKTLDLD